MLARRECGLRFPPPRRATSFAQRWAEAVPARAFALLGWSPDGEASFDGALLPLSLAATPQTDALLAGGRGTGALRLHEVVWPESDDDESEGERMRDDDDEHGDWVSRGRVAPVLVLRDDVQRPSAVSALCALGGGGDGRVRVAVAWLGSGASPGVLSLCEARRGARTKLRERATHVLHASLWAAAVSSGDAGPAVAFLGTSAGALRLDLATMAATTLCRPGSDVLAVAAEASGAWALCGLRNGGVVRADAREPSRASPPHCFRVGASAVTGLSLLGSHWALGCGLDGTLARWDLRAPERGPVATYAGHVNSATLGLRHVADASGALLAAPGEDGAVRLWSLHAAGQPLSQRCAAPAATGIATYTAAAFEPHADAPMRLWLGAHEGLALAAPAAAERRAPGALPPAMQRWDAA